MIVLKMRSGDENGINVFSLKPIKVTYIYLVKGFLK